MVIMPSPSATFPLQRLLTAWGVQMDPSKIVADFSFATTLRGRDNQAEENPLWLSIKPTGMNQEQIITSRLESLLIPVAGAVAPIHDSGYEYEPLLQSSTNAQLVDRYMLRLGNEELRRRFHPEGKPLDLAARLRGTFKSAFPDGPPRQSEDAGAKEPPKSLTAAPAEHLAKGQKPATILVVADADLLFDPFYIEQQNFLGFALSHVFNDNLNFMLNSCESLTGSDALISIRTRGRFERPFLRVEKLRQKAQNQWLEREQQLMAKAEETNQKLNELQHRTDPSQQLLLTRDQAAEIQKFSEEKRRINHELKQVRRNLRVDIERLGTTVKFINIYLIPLLVCGAGLLFALFRRRRRTRPL